MDRNIRDLLQAWLPLEQIERGIRGGAAKRIRHVSRPVHQCLLRVIRPEGIEDFCGRYCGRKRQRASGQRFRECDDVRRDLRLLGSKHGPGAAEPGKHLVEDQEHVVLVREGSQMTQHAGVMEFHPAGTLHQRLDNNGGDRIASVLQQVFECRDCRATFRQIDDVMRGQNAGKTGMHAGCPDR